MPMIDPSYYQQYQQYAMAMDGYKQNRTSVDCEDFSDVLCEKFSIRKSKRSQQTASEATNEINTKLLLLEEVS